MGHMILIVPCLYCALSRKEPPENTYTSAKVEKTCLCFMCARWPPAGPSGAPAALRHFHMMTPTSTSGISASTILSRCMATCRCFTRNSVWTLCCSRPACLTTRPNASSSSSGGGRGGKQPEEGQGHKDWTWIDRQTDGCQIKAQGVDHSRTQIVPQVGLRCGRLRPVRKGCTDKGNLPWAPLSPQPLPTLTVLYPAQSPTTTNVICTSQLPAEKPRGSSVSRSVAAVYFTVTVGLGLLSVHWDCWEQLTCWALFQNCSTCTFTLKEALKVPSIL